ncbi:hypothetical protein BY996DRAFT_6710345, partial [Phakopsora pachyrhizi]
MKNLHNPSFQKTKDRSKTIKSTSTSPSPVPSHNSTDQSNPSSLSRIDSTSSDSAIKKSDSSFLKRLTLNQNQSNRNDNNLQSLRCSSCNLKNGENDKADSYKTLGTPIELLYSDGEVFEFMGVFGSISNPLSSFEKKSSAQSAQSKSLHHKPKAHSTTTIARKKPSKITKKSSKNNLTPANNHTRMHLKESQKCFVRSSYEQELEENYPPRLQNGSSIAPRSRIFKAGPNGSRNFQQSNTLDCEIKEYERRMNKSGNRQCQVLEGGGGELVGELRAKEGELLLMSPTSTRESEQKQQKEENFIMISLKLSSNFSPTKLKTFDQRYHHQDLTVIRHS